MRIDIRMTTSYMWRLALAYRESIDERLWADRGQDMREDHDAMSFSRGLGTARVLEVDQISQRPSPYALHEHVPQVRRSGRMDRQ